MNKLCFGTLVQVLLEADRTLKMRETVEMLLKPVLFYANPPILNQQGEPFAVTDKNASYFVNRKSNLPKRIMKAAMKDDNVRRTFKSHVEKHVCGNISSATVPVITKKITTFLQSDDSIPRDTKSVLVKLSNTDIFLDFFSEVLLYTLQVPNRIDESVKDSVLFSRTDDNSLSKIGIRSSFDLNGYYKLDQEYKAEMNRLVCARLAESNISYQTLCDAFFERHGISINIETMTRLLHKPEDDDFPVILLWEACNLLGISINTLLNAAGNRLEPINHNLLPVDMMNISVTNSKHLVTNPNDPLFRGYLGTYFTYFTPTHSDNSTILKGKLRIFEEGDIVRVSFELDTNLLDDKNKPIVKSYEGMLICSSSVSCCYCVLSSADIGEMSFIMFRHFRIFNQKLQCCMAMAMTTSAGNEDRNPTIHRMLLSREEIRDEDLTVLLPLLHLNNSVITISQHEWDDLSHNNDHFSAIMEKFRVGHELQSIPCYQLRENTIRTTFHNATHSHEASAIPFIAAIRSKAISYRYNKVSKKADKSLLNFLKERGYFKENRKK